MQVSSALFSLRQRNTYQGTSSVRLLKPLAKIGEHGCQLSSFDHSMHHAQESVSHVAEIVESSRTKARSMVDAAMQVKERTLNCCCLDGTLRMDQLCLSLNLFPHLYFLFKHFEIVRIIGTLLIAFHIYVNLSV